ncbi:hypothetical protein Poli38472_008185 [Pythium oligandrum]|uniref:Cytochrome P450 n=1 Tax=Pythium oligandrum TaxID=41045 RepID=A0A8K1CNJ8_PYTOL|nr:hypothetical protein Poli38472_008185 [Pythium oligandrum]|eukprot:TMW65543.1 hypothetical protein Poli38472_008185 [Pythium oligandrum]
MDRLIELEDPKISLVTGTALALLAVSSIHSLRRSKRPNRPYRVLETADSTLPVVGNLVDAITRNDDFHDWFMEQTVRFNGRMWRVVIPGQGEMIVATTPEAVEEVLSTQFDTFVKGAYQIAQDNGQVLLCQRARPVHAAVHPEEHATRPYGDGQRHSNETAWDLNALFHDFTIDTFVEMGLGVDLKSIGATTRHAFNEALDDAARIVSQRFRRPEWAWKLERWMNVGEEAVLKRHMDTVHEWMRGVIQESVDGLIQKKQSGVDTSNQVGKSIVELFLEHADEEKDGLSHNDLIDFVLTLVVGARDTTADTLTWLFYALGKHPEVEKKLRDEMKRELTSDRSTYLTTEQLKPLVY